MHINAMATVELGHHSQVVSLARNCPTGCWPSGQTSAYQRAYLGGTADAGIGIAGVTLVQLRRFELMRTGYIEERMGLRRTPARGLAASTMYPLPT